MGFLTNPNACQIFQILGVVESSQFMQVHLVSKITLIIMQVLSSQFMPYHAYIQLDPFVESFILNLFSTQNPFNFTNTHRWIYSFRN